MSCSRVIIEQRLADLELALKRQEELILSQRDAIRNLRDLIALDNVPPVDRLDSRAALPSPSITYRGSRSSIEEGNVNSNNRPASALSQNTSSTTKTPTQKRSSTMGTYTDDYDDDGRTHREDGVPQQKRARVESAAPVSSSSSAVKIPAPIGQPLKRRRALDKIRQIAILFPPLMRTAMAGSSFVSVSAARRVSTSSSSLITEPFSLPKPAQPVSAVPKPLAASSAHATVAPMFAPNVQRQQRQLEQQQQQVGKKPTTSSSNMSPSEVETADSLSKPAPSASSNGAVRNETMNAPARPRTNSGSSSNPPVFKPVVKGFMYGGVDASDSTNMTTAPMASSVKPTIVPVQQTVDLTQSSPKIMPSSSTSTVNASVAPAPTGSSSRTNPADTTISTQQQQSNGSRSHPSNSQSDVKSGQHPNTSYQKQQLQSLLSEMQARLSNDALLSDGKASFLQNLQSRLKAMESSATAFLNLPKAKTILVNHLKDLQESFTTPSPALVKVLLPLLQVLEAATFTVEEIEETRVHTVLHTMYKKYRHNKDVLGETLIGLFHGLWNTYQLQLNSV